MQRPKLEWMTTSTSMLEGLKKECCLYIRVVGDEEDTELTDVVKKDGPDDELT
jgi:hypothetical protein